MAVAPHGLMAAKHSLTSGCENGEGEEQIEMSEMMKRHGRKAREKLSLVYVDCKKQRPLLLMKATIRGIVMFENSLCSGAYLGRNWRGFQWPKATWESEGLPALLRGPGACSPRNFLKLGCPKCHFRPVLKKEQQFIRSNLVDFLKQDFLQRTCWCARGWWRMVVGAAEAQLSRKKTKRKFECWFLTKYRGSSSKKISGATASIDG